MTAAARPPTARTALSVYATPESNGEPGPGCWRDEAGNYRLPNITLLAAALVLAITAVMFRGVVGCGASVPTAGPRRGRLEPRPELFGYWLLSWQGITLLAVLHRGARTAVDAACT